MEIYAIFNPSTGVYQCALIQGQDYNEIGDDLWLECMNNVNSIFNHSPEDWVLIPEEDFEKYKLGNTGGENGTGYIYDFETEQAISAPPAPEKSYEEKVAEVQANYTAEVAIIKDDYLDAVLNNDDGLIADCKLRYKEVNTQSDKAIKDLINEYFGDKDGGDNGDN